MAYWEWGPAQAAHVVVCVHGLSRQGRDFDVLAHALVAQGAGAVRVVCPDVVGRGRSDWLVDPLGYQIPTYTADMFALLAHLQSAAQVLDWVGTSMGGLIGMAVCGQTQFPLPIPVRRLVLNDVGPVIQWESIVRIGQYLGRAVQFESVRARAFAEPLLACETLDSGENTLVHADAVAAILKGIGGSEAMQAASYLVYACVHLNKPEEVIAKAFGDSFAALAVETTKLMRVQRRPWQPSRWTTLPCRPRTCARCCWPSRATCGWSCCAWRRACKRCVFMRPASGLCRPASRASHCRCLRRWPTAWASGR
jgi:pimeloyl-ACP methyl ester carboxylesterase